MSIEKLMDVEVVSASRQPQKIGELIIGITDVLNETTYLVFDSGHGAALETPSRMFFVRLQYKF